MKKYLTLLIFAGLLMSCHITNREEPTPVTTEGYEAYGLLTVPSSGFTKDNVRTRIVLTDNSQLEIYMYDVKFATMMPVTIDMVISGVHYTKQGGTILFDGDEIIPTAGNKPYEKYTVRQLQGRLTGDSLIISNNYGDTPCTYQGARKQQP